MGNAKIFIIPIILLICFAITGSCYRKNVDKHFETFTYCESGVVVKGYCTEGYIKNTNSYSVRIKSVWQSRGESTQWIYDFKPKEIKYQYISHQNGFYIMNLDGVELGFINPFNKDRSINETKKEI